MTEKILAVILHSGLGRMAWQSIKKQSMIKDVRVWHEPVLDMRYLALPKMFNVKPSDMTGTELLNAGIMLAVAHAYGQCKERYFCVWFDDVEMVDTGFFEKAVKVIDKSHGESLAGIKPLFGKDVGKTSEYLHCAWRLWICRTRRWKNYDLLTLMSAHYPQLYVVAQKFTFGPSIVQLDCEWNHVEALDGGHDYAIFSEHWRG